MSLTYKDLKPGDCWVFIDKACVPTVMVKDADTPEPDDLPEGWQYDWPEPDHTKWKDMRVELLEHYSTHPKPRPLGKGGKKIFKVVETKRVHLGQWYLGIWTLDSAREICQDINEGRDDAGDYRCGTGPISDDGYVIVHAEDLDDRDATIDHLLRKKTFGLSGADCLARFELGMREERVRRENGRMFVLDTNYINGLCCEQTAAAQEIWAKILERRRHEASERERLRVLVDSDIRD